jgi:hypothetical protein
VEYRSLKEILLGKNDILLELEVLFSNKAMVIKPESLQWQFSKGCLIKFLIFSSSQILNPYPKLKKKFCIFYCCTKKEARYSFQSHESFYKKNQKS